MKRTIFKVSKPIDHSQGDWVFETRESSHCFLIPGSMVSGLIKAAMGDGYKIYADMQFIEHRGSIAITSFQKVEDQDW